MTDRPDPATDWHQLHLWAEDRVHTARPRGQERPAESHQAEYSEFRKAEDEKWFAAERARRRGSFDDQDLDIQTKRRTL